MSNIFGWSYPAGAANDKSAPWNQEEGCTEDFCPTCLETYSPEWLAILESGEGPPSPYPLCSEKCAGAEEGREQDAAESMSDWLRENDR